MVKLEPWLSRHANLEGEVTEVLGPAHLPDVAMLSIIRKHDLPMVFPDTVDRKSVV